MPLPPPSRTRRHFLQQASAAGLAWSTHRCFPQQMSHASMPMGQQLPAPPLLRSLDLTPFVDPLPIPATLRPNASGKLRIAMREVHAPIHRDLPPTRQWIYTPLAAPATLAPVIEARSGHPLHIEWLNQLPTQHFLPIDFTLHGCGRDLPEVRACVHLHGGRTPSADDGQPEDWYTPGQSRLCTYPLQQESTALWYHDHAMGLNRLNLYAGLFGQLLLRDTAEDALHLPGGKYEIPLTLYDRNYTAGAQLFYPTSGDPAHPWVSEFAGDAILLNGKIRPFLTVEPRLYRFRLLNSANSRFFNLSFSNNHPFHQIGSDQGLLSAPLELQHLQLAPSERVDLLLDFSQIPAQNLHLLNDHREILQLRIAPASSTNPATGLPSTLRPIERIPESTATVTRTIAIHEYLDKTGNSMLMLLNGKHWHEPVTEQPHLNATEIWEFVNLTEDTHPMHLHLVRFQVLDRRVFDVFAWQNGKGRHYLSNALPPEPNELGWKDVVQCPPGIITRIITRFEGYPGRYLYHCHVLEHEANDMMRPFEVIA